MRVCPLQPQYRFDKTPDPTLPASYSIEILENDKTESLIYRIDMKPNIKLFTSNKNKCPKIIIYLKPIFLSLFLYGFNYNYFTSRRHYKLLSAAYCLSIAIVFCYGLIMSWIGSDVTYWIILEYLCFVVTVLLCKNKTRVFFTKLEKIDMFLRIPLRWNIQFNKFLLLGLLVIIISRIGYFVGYCFYHECAKLLSFNVLNFAALIGLDLYRFWRCAVFVFIYYRIRNFRQRLLEDNGSKMYMFVSQNRTQLGQKIRVFLQLYAELHKSVEYANVELHATVKKCLI